MQNSKCNNADGLSPTVVFSHVACCMVNYKYPVGMTTVTAFDGYMERISRGNRLSPAEIRELAETPDILSIGMLADTVRRRLHDSRVTFLRVAEVALDRATTASVPASAREIRLTGSPEGLDDAVEMVEIVRTASGARTVAGFSWSNVERWSEGSSRGQVLLRLKEAGLDAIADMPLDQIQDASAAVRAAKDAGFRQLRLTIGNATADARASLFLRAAELQDAFGAIQSINPLPLLLSAFRPTTGYEDVKMVALARLAAPNVPSIQVDWQRYGPKLAQVALTFGADDLDAVSGSDEAPEGRRRAPLPEIQRNVEAAGFSPVERDGWFNLL
jgi:aminodeoxyfutalosine synthase